MSQFIEYLREFGRFQRNARLYLLSNAISGVSVGIVQVLYNLYLASLGYRTDFIGLVLFVGILGAGVAIFPAGICIDRFGGKLILIWSSIAIFFAIAGQLLFRQPAPLLISSFLAGVAAAFQLVINAPYLTRNSTREERPHLFSFNIVVTLIATVLGELLGGNLPVWFHTNAWFMALLPSWLGWAFVTPSMSRAYQFALLSAGIFAIPSLPPILLLSNDRPIAPAVPVVGTDLSRPGVPIDEPGRDKSVPTTAIAAMSGLVKKWRKQLQATRLKTLLRSPFFTLVLFQGLIGLGAGLFIPYFNLYFVEQLKASPALFGLLDGGANTINALLTLLAPWLATRIGKIRTIVVTQSLSIPLLLTIGLTPLLPLAASLYLFRQGTMDMSNGLFQVYSMEAVPQERHGVANSTYQAIFQGAEAISTPLGGLIIANIGFAPVFIMGAICYAIATGILWKRFEHRH